MKVLQTDFAVFYSHLVSTRCARFHSSFCLSLPNILFITDLRPLCRDIGFATKCI